ncbi:LPS assembly lipoprotein LptE [Geomonas agri]|uniref:LPS assembly lipoprotein LptE n=1 Tax=Geomonas agri TaxID=2873702 RepID=UPI001CD3A55F|nr:LptE family protein [Geomonas agri]
MTATRLFTMLGMLALLAVLFGSGCSYSPVIQHGPLAGANGVNVVLFANKSYRAGVEAVLAREMIDEFNFRTGGKVLPADRADYELSGVVLSYNNVPVSYTATDVIREYNAILTVQATLRDQKAHKVFWKGDITEQQVYPVNANIALQQDAEDAAIEKISRRISERIWQKLGERF